MPKRNGSPLVGPSHPSDINHDTAPGPSKIPSSVMVKQSPSLSVDRPPDSLSVERKEQASKRSRSRNGCLVCRARRIKCDIGQPECARCVIYGAECVYPQKKAFDPVIIDAALTSRHNKRVTLASDAVGGTDTSPPMSSNPSSSHPPAPPFPASSPASTLNTTPNLDPSPASTLSPITNTAFKPPTTSSPGPTSHARAPRVDGRSPKSPLTQTQMELVHALFRQTKMGGFFSKPAEPPDFLRVAFPIEDDLKCFHHCLTYTLSILTVSEDHNPWVMHIAPLFLFPTGAAPLSTEALKYSMLALGATHLGYLQARTQTAPEVAEQTLVTARMYRDRTINLLRQARDKPHELSHRAFLAACSMLLNNDVLATNVGWREPLRYARKAVHHRGGCGRLLFGDAYAVAGLIPGSTLPSPAPIDRYSVEHVVMIEIIAALSNGGTVTVFGDDSRWWEELGRTGSNERDWESVESTFGVHRELMRLAADVTTLMHDVGKYRTIHGDFAIEPLNTAVPFLSNPILPTNTTSSTLPSSQPALAYSDPLLSTQSFSSTLYPTLPTPALSLMTRTESVEAALTQWRGEAATRTMDARTQIGSFALWHALRILVTREIRGKERGDTECQASAEAVLELCVEVGDKVEFMNWPLIIACSVLTSEDRRQRARDVLKTFSYQCAHEVEVIRVIVEEIWRRVDSGCDEVGCGWTEVATDLGYPVLLG